MAEPSPSCCIRCGRAHPRSTAFCPYCGQSVGEIPPPQAASPQARAPGTPVTDAPDRLPVPPAQPAPPRTPSPAAPPVAPPAAPQQAGNPWVGIVILVGIVVLAAVLLRPKPSAQSEPEPQPEPLVTSVTLPMPQPAPQADPPPPQATDTQPTEPQAAQDPPTGPNPAPTTADLEARASTRTLDFFTQWSSSNDAIAGSFESFYGENVDYYGKSLTRDGVMQEKRAFMARWPERSYRVRDGSMTVMCEPADARCEVSGIVDWVAVSAPRGARSAGVASFRLALAFDSGTGLVTAESSEVISREPQ